jgi:YfiH family protein
MAGTAEAARMERCIQDELRQPVPEPRVAPNGAVWLSVPGWQNPGRANLDWLQCGFSTRQGGESRAYCADGAPGELNLGFTAEDDRQTVLGNRRLFVQALAGDPGTPLATLSQIHSNALAVVGRGDGALSPGWNADGMMTDRPGLLLGILTADCIPVLVADRKRRAVAAFHAGWRGTVRRIVESGIGRMRLEYGSRPEDLIAAIGPGIGPCCYAVGEELLSAFESQFSYARELFREVFDSDPVRTKYPMLFLTQRAPGHSCIGPSLHLNLAEANRRQLLAAGLKPRAIQAVGGCTSCRPELFFSHRASGGRAGRMMSAIGIRKAGPVHHAPPNEQVD